MKIWLCGLLVTILGAGTAVAHERHHHRWGHQGYHSAVPYNFMYPYYPYYGSYYRPAPPQQTYVYCDPWQGQLMRDNSTGELVCVR